MKKGSHTCSPGGCIHGDLLFLIGGAGWLGEGMGWWATGVPWGPAVFILFGIIGLMGGCLMCK